MGWKGTLGFDPIIPLTDKAFSYVYVVLMNIIYIMLLMLTVMNLLVKRVFNALKVFAKYL